MNESIDSPFSVEWVHRLRFTEDAFAKDGVLETLFEELSPMKILTFVDAGLYTSNDSFQSSLEAWRERTANLCAEPVILAGGESTKNDSNVVHGILDEINRNDLCRNSCVLAIGGGAILDAVGYVASIAHRGIPLIRMPSTTLSQGDSGVGVKNGINKCKNFHWR